jgi:hypothetical protein
MFVDLVDLDDVLKAVQARGPVMPMDIRKFLGKGDSITIGAALSTLTSKGQVKFTNVKIGGSPFYYVKGQENRLELLNKYLNDKDKRTFEEIRQSKVLKDSSQEPLIRVSLRNIPDFAKKIELTNNDETVLYWRWHLISEDDAIDIIKGNRRRSDISEQPKQDNDNNQPSSQPVSNQQMNPTHQSAQSSQPTKPAQLNVQQASQSQSGNQIRSSSDEFISENKIVEENKVEENKNESLSEKRAVVKQELKKEKQEIIRQVSEFNFDDDFFKDIKKFFDKNDISLKDAKLIRKGSEYEFVVSLKTPFGETDYFCKAKSKKKCNEGDLSSAYLQGQNKRLPTVFITTGEITKKAKQKASDEYKGLLIKEL